MHTRMSRADDALNLCEMCVCMRIAHHNHKTEVSVADLKKQNREHEDENVAKSCQNVTIPKRDYSRFARFAYKANAFFNMFDLVTI